MGVVVAHSGKRCLGLLGCLDWGFYGGERWRRWWCSVTSAERFTPPACFVEEDDREVARGHCWAELEWAAGARLGLFGSFSLFF
jgi:hypothetical protein